MHESATVVEPVSAAPLRQTLENLANGAPDITACGAPNIVELK